MATKKSDGKPGTGGRPDGLNKLVTPSAELAAIVGSKPLARGEVVSKLWNYVKSNRLQAPEDGRQINADEKLRPIFGKDQISMFEMNKRISAHLS